MSRHPAQSAREVTFCLAECADVTILQMSLERPCFSMVQREFCCNDLPPKGLMFGLGAIAVALGLISVAVGHGLLPFETSWLRAPRWVITGAGVMFIFGGIVISLLALPAHRRERSHQA